MPGTCSASRRARRALDAPVARRSRGGRSPRAPRKPFDGRRGPVEVAAGRQLHVRAGARQRSRQRVVVGRRVGRGVDAAARASARILRCRRGPIPFRRWSRAAWSAPSSPLLVLATVGAFFVTQSLKTEVPVVLRFAAKPRDISPNGDRVRDFTPGRLRPVRAGRGVVLRDRLRGRGGAPAGGRPRAWRATPSTASPGTAATTTATWCPTASTGCAWSRRKEGRGGRLDQGGAGGHPAAAGAASPRWRPNVIAPGVPGGARRVRVRYSGPRNAAPEFRVFRTDVTAAAGGAPVPRRRARAAGCGTGRVRGGGHAPDGSYAFNVLVRDLAGNLTRGARPRPADARRPRARGPAWPCAG